MRIPYFKIYLLFMHCRGELKVKVIRLFAGEKGGENKKKSCTLLQGRGELRVASGESYVCPL